MKLLIPEQLMSLSSEICRCLSISEGKGFCIDHIELVVSPGPWFEITDEKSQTLSLGCDLCKSLADDVGEPDLNIFYSSSYCVEEAASHLGDNQIYIGIEDEDFLLDVWRFNGIKALRSSLSGSSSFSAQKHLSWFLTLLLLDFPVEDSLTLSRANAGVSRETWVSDFQKYPIPVLDDQRLGIEVGWKMKSNNLNLHKLTKQSLGLYPVVDSVKWIERLLISGVKTIQLRIKDRMQPDLEAQIIKAITLGRQYKAQVFINDHWELAIKHGAFGIHLGQEDIETSDLPKVNTAKIRLGLSTHGYYELLRIIQIQPAYIALGHIFPTTTKQMPSKPQGLVRLKLYQELIDTIPYGEKKGCPTVAIGGINLTNAASVWACGVSSLAVVRAITRSSNYEKVIDEFNQVMITSLPEERLNVK